MGVARPGGGVLMGVERPGGVAGDMTPPGKPAVWYSSSSSATHRHTGHVTGS